MPKNFTSPRYLFYFQKRFGPRNVTLTYKLVKTNKFTKCVFYTVA